jgi:UDP-glucose 4-epimerase
VVGDVRDAEMVEKAIDSGTEAVFHLAAVTSVLKSKEDPVGTFETNVDATQLLLERARLSGVTRFILASTNAVAGNSGGATISEASLLAPLTPYGATKAAGEMLLSAYCASYGMGCTAIRLTNVYGIGMQEKDSYIPRLIRAALAPGEIVKIYGDGMQVRDLIFVSDAVAGLMLPMSVAVTGAVTIGFGTSYSVLDLHAEMCKATGIAIAMEHVDGPPGEMRAVVVDTFKAKSLGFAPQVALSEGLLRTWQDMRMPPG